MNRRHFFKTSFNTIKAAAMINLLPNLPLSARAGGREAPKDFPRRAAPWSLRELVAARKHHGKGRYLNPFSEQSYGNLWRVLSWKLFDENHFKSYYADEPHQPVFIDWEPVRKDRDLSITFLKHASLVIKDKGQYIFVDPLFFRLSRLISDFTPLAFDLSELPQPNHVLITHGHYDHLNKPSLASLTNRTHVVSPLGYDAQFKDLNMRQRTQLDWFDTWSSPSLEITLLPCNHWTMRNPLIGPNRSLWGSYLLRTASGLTIYIAGDAAYFDGFEELGQEYDIDLAIFNLGAYEPRWFMKYSHMNPAEVIKAFELLKARRLMIVHWGTFRLGNEPVHFPPLDLEKALAEQGKSDRLINISHGQTVFLDQLAL